MEITVKAHAKINLSLGVCEKAANGYHNIETVMQTISLADVVTVKKTDGGIKVFTGDPEIDSNKKNTAFLAAKEFFAFSGLEGGADIKIKKHIPKAAGLGGGSADAAAILNALNLLYGSELSDNELREIALKIGSDVPFCINGGTSLALGRGEKLTSLSPFPKCYFVLAVKGKKLSTGDMYGKIDAMNSPEKPNITEVISAIAGKDIKKLDSKLINTFESLYNRDDVAAIKEKLRSNGAVCAALSGAGPTVYGIFTDEKSAIDCEKNLKQHCLFTGVFTPIN